MKVSIQQDKKKLGYECYVFIDEREVAQCKNKVSNLLAEKAVASFWEDHQDELLASINSDDILDEVIDALSYKLAQLLKDRLIQVLEVEANAKNPHS